MKRLFLFSLLMLGLNITLSQNRKLPIDTVVTTQHSVTVNGTAFTYTAKTGTQPVWDELGEPMASLHYTYYTRNNVKDRASRPLLISFNGGPGSGSVWMHLAYTGPRILKIDDEGYPVQPYGVKENPYSILDVTDIVYVNPANTGYSRTIPESGKEVDRSKFFGINADIKYLAEWLNTFVTRNNRWSSPKYIIGESYGGTRVMG
ncbi:MAG: carboxypeptidase, partial [Eudoraea sp.]